MRRIGSGSGMTNRIRCTLAAILALACLVGTALQPARAETATPLRITFLNPGKHDEFFWPAVSAAMQAAADQFGFKLEIVYAERDAQAMVTLGRGIIARAAPPDVLILVNEFQAGAGLLQAADAQGIRTFMLLNSFYGDEATAMGAPAARYRHWIGSLVPDNRHAGRRMADALADCVRKTARPGADGKFHILGLLGNSTTPASIDRSAGLAAAMAAHADMTLDRQFNTNWQSGKGHDLTANFLDWARAHDVPLAGVWAANDALALGAIAAAEERKLQPGKDYCIVGLNWSPEAVDLVRAGKMAMTDGGHFLAGGWAMVMLRDYFAGADASGTPLQTTFEMTPIDGRNVAQFVERLGDRDWRRIDFARFSRQPGSDTPYDFSLTKALDRLRPLP
jgi:ABC-type sugar transport system substrate-binding protein